MRISRCASDLPIPLELSFEVDAAQDNAWRSAFELHSQEFASGTLFNPIAESHELCLALVGPGPRYTFQLIHGGGRNGAGYLPLAVNHRKQHDHPVELVAEKSTTCERHWTSSFPSLQVNRPTLALPDR
jgi:hypothetical protein